MDNTAPPSEEPPAPKQSPHGFSRLGKLAWTVIGVFAAFGIFLIGLISSGGTGCKDNAGNATTCNSSGHGGGTFVGGTSSATTARGGFGSTGAAHAGGGG